MTQFKLEEHEINSALWQKLKERYETKLATLRAANDNDCPDDQTKRRRGRIAEIKEFLAIGNPKQVAEEE